MIFVKENMGNLYADVRIPVMSYIFLFRKERLTFSNQWEALEFQIKKQDDEIERLKNTQKVVVHHRIFRPV